MSYHRAVRERTAPDCNKTSKGAHYMTTLTDHPAPLAPEVSPAGGLHARLAASLEDMAQYIRAHPDLPVPDSIEMHYCIPASSDKAGEDEAWRIAAILGAAVTGDEITQTELSFGAASYRATYIAREWMASYSAHMASFHAGQAERRDGAEA